MEDNNWQQNYNFEQHGNYTLYAAKQQARLLRQQHPWLKNYVSDLLEGPHQYLEAYVKSDPEYREFEDIQVVWEVINRLYQAANASDEGFSEMGGGKKKKKSSKRKTKKSKSKSKRKRSARKH